MGSVEVGPAAGPAAGSEAGLLDAPMIRRGPQEEESEAVIPVTENSIARACAKTFLLQHPYGLKYIVDALEAGVQVFGMISWQSDPGADRCWLSQFGKPDTQTLIVLQACHLDNACTQAMCVDVNEDANQRLASMRCQSKAGPYA